MKILHILNGDSTLEVFKRAGIKGDVLVWREVLSEGPVSAAIGEDDFFKIRSEWITKAFNSTEDYNKKVFSEFSKLKNVADFAEVVLWFEFDLHCQINLLFLLNYFSKIELPKTVLWLICPSSHPHHPDFRGIGQLSPDELKGLYPEKVRLRAKDFIIAVAAWRAYCSGNPQQINLVLNQDFGKLYLLKPALKAHLIRLPKDGESLSLFEQNLIQIAGTSLKSRLNIYNEFWKNSSIYGMGDAEIDLYLNKLLEQNLIDIAD